VKKKDCECVVWRGQYFVLIGYAIHTRNHKYKLPTTSRGRESLTSSVLFPCFSFESGLLEVLMIVIVIVCVDVSKYSRTARPRFIPQLYHTQSTHSLHLTLTLTLTYDSPQWPSPIRCTTARWGLMTILPGPMTVSFTCKAKRGPSAVR